MPCQVICCFKTSKQQKHMNKRNLARALKLCTVLIATRYYAQIHTIGKSRKIATSEKQKLINECVNSPVVKKRLSAPVFFLLRRFRLPGPANC